GWVCTRLHPEDSMGEVYLIVVNPSRQGMSVGRALLERAYERARTAGMRMIMVETGDDSGHGPARALYESDGFVRWAVDRNFKEMQSGQYRLSVAGVGVFKDCQLIASYQMGRASVHQKADQARVSVLPLPVAPTQADVVADPDRNP